MKGRWAVLMVGVLSLPCMGASGLSAGEMVAAWASALATFSAAVLWLGRNFKAWRRQLVADAVQKQEQADREAQERYREAQERKEIAERLDEGARMFAEIAETLAGVSRAHKGNRKQIARLTKRIEGIETRCVERHREAV